MVMGRLPGVVGTASVTWNWVGGLVGDCGGGGGGCGGLVGVGTGDGEGSGSRWPKTIVWDDPGVVTVNP